MANKSSGSMGIMLNVRLRRLVSVLAGQVRWWTSGIWVGRWGLDPRTSPGKHLAAYYQAIERLLLNCKSNVFLG